MKKKYKLTDESIHHFGKILYRIEALCDFSDVEEGEKGGFIASEDNLIKLTFLQIIKVESMEELRTECRFFSGARSSRLRLLRKSSTPLILSKGRRKH